MPDTVDGHVAAAKELAANEQTALITLCNPPAAPGPARANQPARGAQPPAPPDRSRWAAEPVKVFDNLYYVGEKEYSAWAVTTSAGIIIIDAIYDYSVADQVAGGLKKLGLDPASIKYVVISHAHRDHVGGAWYCRSATVRDVLMSADDWDLLGRTGGAWPKAKRDMTVIDGQQLDAGRHDITLLRNSRSHAWHDLHFGACEGPGHGSRCGPVGRHRVQLHDHAGQARVVLVRRLYQVRGALPRRGGQGRADIFLSNHPSWDGSVAKMAALAKRGPSIRIHTSLVRRACNVI